MGSVVGNATRLIDNDGDPLDSNGKLNVNATLEAGTSIDIGDVDIHLSGNVPLLGNAGAVAAGVLRVTLASDDVHFGAVGAAADYDGALHAQLAYANTRLLSIENEITTADTSLGYLVGIIQTEDVQHDSADGGYMSLAVRNNTLGTLVNADGDYAPFQVDAKGSLYVTIGADLATHDDAVVANGMQVMGEAKVIDGSALPNATAEGDAIRVAASRAGIQYMCLTDDGGLIAPPNATDDSAQDSTPGMLNVGGEYRSSDTTYTDGDATILQTNVNGLLRVDGSDVTQPISGTVTANLGTTDNAVLDAIAASLALLDNSIASGSELQVDVVASLPAGTNAIGKLSANSGVDIGDVTVDNLPNWFTPDAGTAPSPVQIPTVTYDALDGVMMAGVVCKDVLAANSGVTDDEYTTLQVDTQGALYTTHGITGMVSGNNTDISDSTAEILRALGNVACKRVDMMSPIANTGVIYVGASNVSATNGIALNPGDFYSVDVNGTSDIYVLAEVDGEDIYFTYFT